MISDQNTIEVRLATKDDSDLILGWRNDPLTRQMAINQNEVSPHEHTAWLVGVLRRNDRVLLIGEGSDGRPVGVVRFDIEQEKKCAEVSITVAPEARGLGLSSKLLQAGIAYLRSLASLQGLHHKFVARIRQGNMASLSCFRRVGFVVTSEDAEYVHLEIL